MGGEPIQKSHTLLTVFVEGSEDQFSQESVRSRKDFSIPADKDNCVSDSGSHIALVFRNAM